MAKNVVRDIGRMTYRYRDEIPVFLIFDMVVIRNQEFVANRTKLW